MRPSTESTFKAAIRLDGRLDAAGVLLCITTLFTVRMAITVGYNTPKASIRRLPLSPGMVGQRDRQQASDLLSDQHHRLMRMRLDGLDGIEIGPSLGRGSYGRVYKGAQQLCSCTNLRRCSPTESVRECPYRIEASSALPSADISASVTTPCQKRS